MSKSKRLLNIFLNKFGVFIVFIIIGIAGSIFTGDFKSAFKIILDSWYILITLVTLILIAVYRVRIKGILGEKSVQRMILKLDKEKYRAFNDIMIQTDNKTTQIDHIVISNYGIFVIETKNYKGWIIGSEYDSYWTQVIYKRKEKLYNPIKQNYGHIQAPKKHLSEYGDIPYYSIISFTRNAELKVTATHTDVIYIDMLVDTIKKQDKQVISDNQKDDICNNLTKLNIKDRKARKQHISDIKENTKNRQTKS